MNEIRSNFISGIMILPLVIILPQVQHTSFLLLQSILIRNDRIIHIAVLFFVQKSFRANLRLILDSITAESEKFYLEKMFDSTLALLPHHLLVFLIYFSRKEFLIYIFFFVCMLLIIIIRIQGLITTIQLSKLINVGKSKEITKKDPFLEKRLFFLTFLSICADTISLSFFAFPLTFMIYFAGSVQGFGFFSLWLIASWQTDNGSVFFANLLINKNQETRSPKTTWEGISGGIFLSVVTSFIISLYKEKSAYIAKMATFHFLMISLGISVVAILCEFVNSFLKKSLIAKKEKNFVVFSIGIIDRFGSLIFSSPIVYFYAKVILKY